MGRRIGKEPEPGVSAEGGSALGSVFDERMGLRP